MKRALWLAVGLTACAPAVECPPCEEVVTPVVAGGEVLAPPPVALPYAVSDDGVVRLEGTPTVAPELLARLDQYVETRSASVFDVSADGHTLLMGTRFANTAQAHLVRQPLGARRQLSFGDEPVYGAAFHPRDPNVVIVQADLGGSENYQLYRLDLTNGRQTLLTDGRSRNPEFVFDRTGERLAYTSNARNGRDVDIWMSDGESTGRLALERTGDWHVLEFSRDGHRLLLSEFVSITEQRTFVLDVATGVVTRLSPEGDGADRAAVFAADGQHVYLASDRGTDFVELYEIDLAHPERSAWRALSHDIAWNVEELALSGDGRTLAYSINEGGISQLRLLDTRSRRSIAASDLPPGVLTGLRAASNAPTFFFSIGGATMSGDVFALDARTRRVTRWTESEMGGLDPRTLIEPTLVSFPTFDGRAIPAFYFRPRGEGPFPVVVSIHGGPEAQARPWFSPLMQYLLVEQHVAVLMPNVRGSDGYGRGYLALDDGRHREDSVRDIGALLDWIGQQRELDAGRVAVYGGSYGGYMVLASLEHHGARLRAGVDVVGIANFVTFLENTAAYRRDLRRVEYGDESDPEMRTFLASISPTAHVDALRTPLFVAHGANDPRVPAGEAEQIVAAVRASGADVWYMLARNEGHGFIRKANRDVFNALAATFLLTHLAPR